MYHRGGYRCPFDVKMLNTSYNSLFQHATGRSNAGGWKPRDREKHKALAE
jgi:hypothetical protein